MAGTEDAPGSSHIHTELDLAEGQLVQVTLEGNAANVLLLDDAGYRGYREGEPYEAAAGGYYTRSPVVLRPPAPGTWHLVVDLGGAPGEVQASISVRPGELPLR